MTGDKGVATNSNPLEQFVLLAKSAKGAAVVELIKQVLEAPGVYVFGELLDMPHIIELESGPYANYYRTLHLFAYGTYQMYLEKRHEFFELNAVQKKKLQHLTIVTLATKSKCISYFTLLKELDIKNVRDLEDLIIEAVYADIIHGKLDQKNNQLEVDYAIGRDIRTEDLGFIVSTLQEWCSSCETVLGCVEEQINRANAEKNRSIKHKEAVEQKINGIKKSLKTQNQENEESMSSDPREAAGHSGDKGKRPIKVKALRGGSKFWQKS